MEEVNPDEPPMDMDRRQRSRRRGRSIRKSIARVAKRGRRRRDGEEGSGSRPRREKRRRREDGDNQPRREDGRPEGRGRRARRRLRQSVRHMAPKRVARSVRHIAPPEECSIGRLLSYVIPILIIIVASIGIVIASGNGSKITPPALGNVIPNFNNKDTEDPFAGVSTDVPRWNTNGASGLELELLNALADEWQVFFALAVADWDFGNPDALTLSSRQVDYDFDCKAVAGTIKVCNGDYGETKWRGINFAMIGEGGFIASSSAKMNEFYLQFESDGTKQYTMCHELGHGFGLPHSDENFENADLGTCMDYTNNFDANKHPDETNYEYLTDLYGPTGGRRSLSVAPKATISGHIHSKMHHEVKKLEQRLDDNAWEDGWNLLHRNSNGEMHEKDLGEGYSVRVHMLLA